MKNDLMVLVGPPYNLTIEETKKFFDFNGLSLEEVIAIQRFFFDDHSKYSPECLNECTLIVLRRVHKLKVARSLVPAGA